RTESRFTGSCETARTPEPCRCAGKARWAPQATRSSKAATATTTRSSFGSRLREARLCPLEQKASAAEHRSNGFVKEHADGNARPDPAYGQRGQAAGCGAPLPYASVATLLAGAARRGRHLVRVRRAAATPRSQRRSDPAAGRHPGGGLTVAARGTRRTVHSTRLLGRPEERRIRADTHDRRPGPHPLPPLGRQARRPAAELPRRRNVRPQTAFTGA